MTHPANQVIDELGERLRIGIRPFQRTKRQALIHRLLTDPRVQVAAEQLRAARIALPCPRRCAGSSATRARSSRRSTPISTSASATGSAAGSRGRCTACVWAIWTPRASPKIPPDATVVFVMNHRSNMDYILAAYLAADQAALSYAVGEWARLWPLSALIRAMGAYFVRRNSERRALPARARALHRDGDRGRRAAGALPRGRPDARRPHPRAAARA